MTNANGPILRARAHLRWLVPLILGWLILAGVVMFVLVRGPEIRLALGSTCSDRLGPGQLQSCVRNCTTDPTLRGILGGLAASSFGGSLGMLASTLFAHSRRQRITAASSLAMAVGLFACTFAFAIGC